MGSGMMGGYGGYGMGWSGIIVMITFWVLLIVGLVFLIRYLATSSKNENPDTEGKDTALEILKKRYASGEIDKDEFEERRRDLQ